MKKILATLLMIALLICHTLAFGEGTQENPWAGIDLSKPETITVYCVGTLGDDWQRVTELANEKLREKINTTINWVHISWGDFQSNYALYLSGSEDVDLIYGATWCNYMDYVKAGAFKGFDDDFVQTYMPLTWRNQAKASWNEVSYDGMYWGVPNNYSGIDKTVFVTTRELMDKYGYSEETVTNCEQLGEYLKAVAAGEKGTGLYAINCQSNWPTNIYWLTQQYHFFDLDTASATWMMWNYDKGEFNVEDLHWWADSPEFVAYAKQMADLYQNGVFPSDVIASERFIGDTFSAGVSAIDVMNCATADARKAELAAQGKELVVLDVFSDEDIHSRRGNYMGYCCAFPLGSTKTERAAVALDCMKNDPEINMLLLAGIEGEHYLLNREANTYTPGPKASAYGFNSWFHVLQNDSSPELQISDPQLSELKAEYVSKATDSFPVNGFTYDGTQCQTEIALLSSLMQEYQWSFCFGLYGDETESKCEQFLQEARAAGLDRVVEDYRRQLSEYLAR